MSSNESRGCVVGATWILTGLAWILIGIWSYNFMTVDSFGRAIVWLIVWHILTAVCRFAIWGIALLISENS